jgi:hypothetical protein
VAWPPGFGSSSDGSAEVEARPLKALEALEALEALKALKALEHRR